MTHENFSSNMYISEWTKYPKLTEMTVMILEMNTGQDFRGHRLPPSGNNNVLTVYFRYSTAEAFPDGPEQSAKPAM